MIINYFKFSNKVDKLLLLPFLENILQGRSARGIRQDVSVKRPFRPPVPLFGIRGFTFRAVAAENFISRSRSFGRFLLTFNGSSPAGAGSSTAFIFFLEAAQFRHQCVYSHNLLCPPRTAIPIEPLHLHVATRSSQALFGLQEKGLLSGAF